ncbi:hypothetical protein BS47DRAFT_1350626 [Hydnum rufescens UP504]|uniref:Uncharacterized protein n=1 Tax=Hydnum rufescens UP504 TaxID=1448309 RepID=A0A9P6DNQ7_9AGAM|nr:hypothetical protein BS47DRAFT_1350626 [Hydnum rufescens UP504]
MLYCTCPTIQINPNLLKLHLSLDPPNTHIMSTLVCSDVDLLRQDLIDYYPKVEAMLPHSIDERRRE